jgi:hypothetical protein
MHNFQKRNIYSFYSFIEILLGSKYFLYKKLRKKFSFIYKPKKNYLKKAISFFRVNKFKKNKNIKRVVSHYF